MESEVQMGFDESEAEEDAGTGSVPMTKMDINLTSEMDDS